MCLEKMSGLYNQPQDPWNIGSLGSEPSKNFCRNSCWHSTMSLHYSHLTI